MAYTSKSVGERILANLDFIGEVFKDYRSDELPDVPFLALAGCFELDDKDER